MRTFTAHLRANAGRYYADLGGGPVSVTLEREVRRPGTTLYHFAIGPDGGAGRAARHVVVKAYAGLNNEPATDEALPLRPRSTLGGAPTHVVEYRALVAIERHLPAAVRPLDHLTEHRAIVMEFCSLPTLRDVLLRATRGRRAPAVLLPAFSGAGNWLRTYHATVEAERPEPLRSRTEELRDALDRYGRYLAASAVGGGAVPRLVAEADARFPSALAGPLPVAAIHGDFAPRNIFVDGDRPVRVIDAHPTWAVPRYEDVARLLVNVRTAGLQVVSHGLAFDAGVLAACEHAFLTAYFGDAPPLAAVRAYELLVLFDRWAAWVDRRRRASTSPARRALWWPRGAAVDAYYRSEAERLVRALAATEPVG